MTLSPHFLTVKPSIESSSYNLLGFLVRYFKCGLLIVYCLQLNHLFLQDLEELHSQFNTAYSPTHPYKVHTLLPLSSYQRYYEDIQNTGLSVVNILRCVMSKCNSLTSFSGRTVRKSLSFFASGPPNVDYFTIHYSGNKQLI